ncbi:MAG TPA: EAL domain-containing protein [Steroidobacteraceae bacterium]|nr:EAL domain-containing protein [Steroidobacteraceae bacterium]
MFSLKTKFAAFGAAIALLLLAAGGIAVFALLRHPVDFAQETGIVTRLALIIAGAAILGTAWFAFLQGRRIAHALQQLNDSTARMSAGDFTRPVRTLRRDELGDLQRTIDQMRQNLADTTVNKNYLDNVLNSMSDAVFVARTDGTIKFTNSAAQRLTGLPAEALNERTVASLLHGADISEADRIRRACEVGEAVLRTESGQTIPVSFSCSTIETSDPQFAGLIYVARDITDRKRAERRIRYLARYDALTKIPNRMQFQHLLQQAIARSLRTRTGLALLYLDMDRFKEVNDTFGHGAGDRVLEALTERLNSVLPTETVLGRLAGDEFALFIDGISEGTAREVVRLLSQDILAAVAQPFHIGQQEVFLSASIGVALCPRDAENVIDLIRNADAAMYYSKQNGGNSCAFYSPEMNAASVERLMLKSKLKRAIERDELVVAYMPKIDLADGRIVGAEALLRWRVPGHGDIPPSQFIPLAEENNLISSIGEWVLNRVCLDYRALSQAGHAPGRIALNLSLKQLRQASFILDCKSVFARHGVSPRQLELEITETTLMADPKRTVGMLDELAALGLHLAIDDFGTGYSSLSALQQFPIGSLKIDQSFVRDATTDRNDATIVRTIIEMGHSLSMQVVAEGVETLDQFSFLRAAGCDYAQGQLFGEPCSADTLGELLARQVHSGQSPFATLLPPGATESTGTRAR